MHSPRSLIICFAFALILTSATYRQAHAYTATEDGCMTQCMQRNGCDIEYQAGGAFDAEDKCEPTLIGCDTQCIPRAQEIYGAIAYDQKTGNWGMSDAVGDPETAETSALFFCGKDDAGCQIIGRVKNACAAVAYGQDNALVWAEGASEALAQKEVIKYCESKSNGACIVKHSNCYGKQ